MTDLVDLATAVLRSGTVAAVVCVVLIVLRAPRPPYTGVMPCTP